MPSMSDEEALGKMDRGMREAWRAYRAVVPGAHTSDALTVSVHLRGDVDAIRALGFEVCSVAGNVARGVLRFADVAAVAAHPDVLRISVGSQRTHELDTAVHDIVVRANAPVPAAGAPDGLWHVDPTSGVLTHTTSPTGTGVIVAVIDTGIDYTHPMFHRQLSPPQTRILEIWDQGLTPSVIGDCPPVSFLVSPNTYGVKFDSAAINASLASGTALPHRDCVGHGTHVAGIAAGGTIFPRAVGAPPVDGDARRVGVAPRADILVVKYLDVPETIHYFGTTTDVNASFRFRDAVMYCLRYAAGDPAAIPPRPRRPVVINLSLGFSGEAGDGLDEDTLWMDSVMNPAANTNVGVDTFPTGAVIVKAAGNDGRGALGARVVVPVTGSVTIPLNLIDTRTGTSQKRRRCTLSRFEPEISAWLWYHTPNGAATPVQCWLRLPFATSFGPVVDPGMMWEQKFRSRRPSPPLFVTSGSGHTATLDHGINPDVPLLHGGPPTVRRKLIELSVKPKRSGSDVLYHDGRYEVKVDAPAGTVIFVLGGVQSWGPSLNVRFEVGTQIQNPALPADPTALLPIDPAVIEITPRFRVVDGGGRHAITVASYRDSNHAIADSSSRGPMRDFTEPPTGPIAAKPDVAAPGVSIDSALSHDADQLIPAAARTPLFNAGARFHPLQGTSMAAPMVSGVVALMFQRLPGLNTNDVRTRLRSVTRPAVAPPPADPEAPFAYGAGMLDGRRSFNLP